MIQVKNWPSYQSYKDRKPPWIRLHKTLLDNYEFQNMSANARALLPMLWLLASEDEDPVSGSIRYGYEKIAFRLRLPLKDIEKAIMEMRDADFINIIPPCSETVTEPLRNGEESVTPETYRSRHIDLEETEKRQKEKHLDAVMLTANEYEKLLARFGEEGRTERIVRLNNYIMSKGKKYKSHYHTILSWAEKDPKPATPSTPVKSRAFCAYPDCNKIGVIGQGGRMFCREHWVDE